MKKKLSKEKLKNKENKTTKNIEEEKDTKQVKNEKQEMIIQEFELEEIQKEIKNETIIPKEKKNELYKKIFDNIISEIVILVYFIFIYVVYKVIENTKFEVILKMSSMIFIISTIVIFEYAYKKESIKYTIQGIEMLVVSITTLITMQIYKLYNTKLTNAITIIAVAFSIYYITKSIISYIKYKKEIRKQVNNIYRTTKRNEVK